jgi:hypothetical protein
MSTVWKNAHIPGGKIFNHPGAKELIINTWNREIQFLRYKDRYCETSFVVVASEGEYKDPDNHGYKLFYPNKSKRFYFGSNENKAMKKFMDLAFNGLAK